MSYSNQRTIRLSQAINPFGVGSIYDILGESLVACDTSYWKGRGQRLQLKRLSEAMGVDEFRMPPLKGLLYTRFPQWLFCPQCRHMVFWTSNKEQEGHAPHCQTCRKRQLVPMRFIMICEDGHMDDVDWRYWAHIGAKEAEQRQCHKRDQLYFVTGSGGGSGLSSLRIKCDACGASRTLDGITGKDSVRPFGITCRGRQPWQSRDSGDPTCERIPQVVQRGASNVYFPVVRSALDIPPDSNFSQYGDLVLSITNHKYYRVLMSETDAFTIQYFAGQIADDLKCEPQAVLDCIAANAEENAAPGQRGGQPHDLELAEWKAMTTIRSQQDERDQFISEHVSLLDASISEPPPALHQLAALIDKVVILRKLREVRALAGFSRYHPSAGLEGEEVGKLVAPDLGRGLSWLPALEVFGEGVFLSLNENALQSWERQPSLPARCGRIAERRAGSVYREILPEPTPRFLLLHTLAHLLIRQLAFDCGYSSSSLRERIYSRTPAQAGDGPSQAGILVYTAAGDAEGTLGGLARQGESPRLARTILLALQRAQWCSVDPVCIESHGQGVDGMNLAACHACALASETSCTCMNLLLDRAMVIGTGGVDLSGYFQPVLDSILHPSAP